MVDHMFFDGLEDAYECGRLMGSFAEDCAKKYQFSRDAQDLYATTSLNRAMLATETGALSAEITSVASKSRKGEQIITSDEQPRNARPDKISQLEHFRPA